MDSENLKMNREMDKQEAGCGQDGQGAADWESSAMEKSWVEPGTLYLVPTPIGNLYDMTYRAVALLHQVDLIACEDTRTSGVLLSQFGIKTPTVSYHKYNERERGEELLEKLSSGSSVAVITDAGTPGISDPGEVLTKLCYEQNIPVYALPGAVAATTALVSSGQDAGAFYFQGFLPRDKKPRREALADLKSRRETVILYESPHHLKATLKELAETLGPGRSITLCRELTKHYEEKLRMSLSEAISYYETKDPKGEYVLVLSGPSKEALEEARIKQWQDISLQDHMQQYLDQGLDKKAAMKQVAADRGMKKRDVYQALLEG